MHACQSRAQSSAACLVQQFSFQITYQIIILLEQHVYFVLWYFSPGTSYQLFGGEKFFHKKWQENHEPQANLQSVISGDYFEQDDSSTVYLQLFSLSAFCVCLCQDSPVLSVAVVNESCTVSDNTTLRPCS